MTTEEVSVQEAAHRLQVSVKTIERRIKARQIEARKVGGRWLVAVPVSEVSVQSPAIPTESRQNPDISVAIHGQAVILSELATRLSDMTDKVASLESLTKNQTNGLASDLQSVIKCMQEQANAIETLRAELAEARRPWWKRWRK